MRDQVSIRAGLDNFAACIALAVERSLGVDLMAFALPQVLDGNWRKLMADYKVALAEVPGPVTMHGPFMDLVSGSPDERINAVTYERYEHAIRIAAGLDIGMVTFHANYIGLLHNETYRRGWHQRNVDFWGPLGDYAQAYGVLVAIENMWEYDPNIIGSLLAELNHPHLKSCLDVGHAHLFSDADFSFDTWLETMDEWVIQVHMNNHDGIMDEHHSFDWERGVLNYEHILLKLRHLSNRPLMTLEMDRLEDIKQSLRYFQLDGPA